MVKAALTSIVFYNESNGFLVARAQDEKGRPLTVRGNLPGAKAGRSFEFSGSVAVHPRYGEQFVFTSYTETQPESTDEIENFLASGIVRGVGPKTARLIVAKFGDEALDIIENEPKRLMEVEGIGPKKWPGINESYKEHKEFAEVIMQFGQFGIGAAAAMKLYEHYGPDAVAVIRKNPYCMVEDVKGIGFKTADEIAARIGISPDSEDRIRSGVIYVLRRYAQDGSTCVPEARLIENAARLLDVARDAAEDALIAMNFEGKVVREDVDGRAFAFLPAYYVAEKAIAYDMVRIADAELSPRLNDVDTLVAAAGERTGLALSDSQRKAVAGSLSNGVFVITGGPGTGKTTIIHVISEVLSIKGIDIAIAAPTGRAAKRITEATGYAASTIHRLLEYAPLGYDDDEESMSFGRNREKPLEAGAVIVDEASMIDALLMKALLEAIPSGTRLIIVGDADQLPPVGAGNVLRDTLASARVPAAVLTDIFRQSGRSGIALGAHEINSGGRPDLSDRDSDLTIVTREAGGDILSAIVKLCLRNPGAQVLTPVKKNLLGSINLNRELQRVINPPAPEKTEREIGARLFRVGDRVMQLKNNYRLKWVDRNDFSEGEGVFNGDMGVIDAIDDDGVITVCFDGSRYATYEPIDVDQIDHAYAITVHKSQGSEFDTVILPVFAAPPMLATRNLLYTAVTRGKKRVVIVGAEHRFHAMIDNDTHSERWSALRNFLDKAQAAEALFKTATDAYPSDPAIDPYPSDPTDAIDPYQDADENYD
ncbi:MAG: ATP-dependent RecD-like DNA helicase [Clostridiales Family XIII bacterium]|jgi:exodeoxyribonuclease V alpha subunit|nr:ATP-dependent RecD-like DNA helicase [Clostridiales Family XIII bacterium]